MCKSIPNANIKKTLCMGYRVAAVSDNRSYSKLELNCRVTFWFYTDQYFTILQLTVQQLWGHGFNIILILSPCLLLKGLKCYGWDCKYIKLMDCFFISSFIYLKAYNNISWQNSLARRIIFLKFNQQWLIKMSVLINTLVQVVWTIHNRNSIS